MERQVEEQRIKLDDLRQKIDRLNAAVGAELKSRRSDMYAGAAAAVAAAVLVSYFVGKRRGRQRSHCPAR